MTPQKKKRDAAVNEHDLTGTAEHLAGPVSGDSRRPLTDLGPLRGRAGVSAVLRSLPDPAVVVGADHRILLANRSCNTLCGARRELVGRRCHEVFHQRGTPCERSGENCPVQHYRETGQPCRVVHVHHTARGEEHHEISIYPLTEGEEKPEAFLQILRPVLFAGTGSHPEHALVGRSHPFNRMLGLILRVAPRDTPALLLGEPGTGKQTVARAIHQLSRRWANPFVPVNCTGLGVARVEQQLLGDPAEAGSSGAGTKGKIDAARGGTLFLDGVGDLSLVAQSHLLRVLKGHTQTQDYVTAAATPAFRLVCSGPADLPQRVVDGRFLAELYHYIDAFRIMVPPLRERREDIPLLTRFFLERMRRNPLTRIHPQALAALRAYPFPGNIPELRSILANACLLAHDGLILPHHLPPECQVGPC